MPEEPLPLRILLVEDSEDDAFLFIRHFKKAGYQVEFQQVATAGALRQKLADEPWDIVLSDYSMPSFNGLEALNLIRNEGLDIPFILISGAIGEELAVSAMKAGANDYLLKSNLTRLIPVVERELREAASRRQKRNTELILKQTEERYRLVIEGSYDGIWDWDIYNDSLFWNNRLFEMFGISPEDFIPSFKTWVELIHPEDRQKMLDAFQEHFEQHTKFETEIRSLHTSDEYKYFVVKGKAIRDEFGEPIRMTGVMIDMTDIRKVEMAFRKAKDIFVATLTHDLKTPIKAEHWALQALKQEKYGSVNTAQQEIINEIIKSNQFMHHIIDNLLTNYRLEGVDIQLNLELGDLNEMIASLLNQGLRPLIEEKNQEVQFTPDPNLTSFRFDPFEIQRVLHNLIHNAVAYTPQGGVLKVQTCLQPHQVQICIEDNGPGIPPDKLTHLFEPYSTMAKKFRHIGSGLGLYLSKQIIELHGGELHVSTEVGKGSRFCFTLPYSNPLSISDGEGESVRRA